MDQAGTDSRLQTQIQFETDINTLSMDHGGRKRDAAASVGAADGTADELLEQFRGMSGAITTDWTGRRLPSG